MHERRKIIKYLGQPQSYRARAAIVLFHSDPNIVERSNFPISQSLTSTHLQGFLSGEALAFVDINFMVAHLIMMDIIEAILTNTTKHNSMKAKPTTIMCAISCIDVNKN